jgi:hypothetical protein
MTDAAELLAGARAVSHYLPSSACTSNVSSLFVVRRPGPDPRYWPMRTTTS